MNEICKALIKFQSECPSIEKDSEVTVKTKTGSTYKFKYATFGNIIQTIKKAMSDARLAYTFFTHDGKMTCRVFHESGQHIDTSIEMPKFKESMQENGSLLTYSKRYTLVLALGLDTDADDDNNTAEGNEVEFTKGPYKPKESVKNTDAYIAKKGSDIKNYVVQVGKFKGRRLSEIDMLDIQSYLTWLHGQAKEKNQPLTGQWLDFAKIAEAYIAPNEELS